MKFSKVFLSVLMAIILLATSFQFPLAIGSANANEQEESVEKLLLSGNIVSDHHFSSGSNNFKIALNDMYRLNPDASVLVNNGDFVNGGSQKEYDDVKKVLDSIPHPENVFYGLGNHELYTVTRTWAANPLESPEVAIKRYEDFAGEDKTYFEKVVNGYPFLFIGTEVFHASDAVEVSQEQLDWLQNRLKYYSNKNLPIFVFAHQPFKNTVPATRNGELPNYGSSYINEEEITSLLGKYSNVIVFSGHTHQHLDQDDWALKTQYGFYAVNDGGIVDTWKLVKDSNGNTREVWNGSNPQGVYMEVFKDKVVLKGRDYKNGKFIREYIIPIQDIKKPSYTLKINDQQPEENGMTFEDANHIQIDMEAWDNLSGVADSKIYVDGTIYENGSEIDFAGKLGSHSIRVVISDKAGNVTDETTIFNIKTSLSSLQSLIERYIATGELKAPLAQQLKNDKNQAEHHWDNGTKQQAIKHLEKILKYLDKNTNKELISTKAKSTIKTDVEAISSEWSK
jgi:3',5'-cyclic AMP phosphodiesterase CpdA